MLIKQAVAIAIGKFNPLQKQKKQENQEKNSKRKA